MVFRMGHIQERFTTSEDIYRDLIPHDHILYQIYEKVDFSFVNDECRELYCEDNGHPVVHEPVKLFRAAIVQYFYGLSDRGTEEGVNYNLVYRWFVGYQLKGDNDVVFNYSALSKFRKRLGHEKFYTLFNRILDQIRTSGLISTDEAQSVDATNVIADIAIPSTIHLIRQCLRRIHHTTKKQLMPLEVKGLVEFLNLKERPDTLVKEKETRLLRAVRLSREVLSMLETNNLSSDLKEARNDLRSVLQDYIEEEPEVIARKKKGGDRMISPVDRDARWGAKSDKKIFPGYKVHTTESENEFVTGIDVTSGNTSDDAVLPELVDDLNERGMKPKKMRGDGKYGTLDNRKKLKVNGTWLSAPEINGRNTHGGFAIGKFEYESEIEKQCLRCPAGKFAEKSYFVKRTKRMTFFFSKEDCSVCKMKTDCTGSERRSVSVPVEDLGLLEEVKIYNAGEEYCEDRRKRARIEPKQGEMKNLHGLKRAKYRGLFRIKVQAIMTAIVVNLKRFVKLLNLSENSECRGLSSTT
ncbi:MAG TPA: IS1182 family transposase [Nitrospirae bacterium]|nr:IS1182 family transposase [Nitrospirota bacterium]